MVKTAYVTGYKSYELNIFKDDAPEVKYLKLFLKNKIQNLVEEGLEWLLIQGQLGIEMWTAEVVLDLQQDYPELKLGVITPFQNHTERWNEQNQLKYQQIIEGADFHDSVHHAPYEGPFQFKQTDQFMLDHTDMTILIYDEEQEASPKFFKRVLVDFAEQTNYTYDVVTFDEINTFISDIQWSEESFE
ncbi:SLOG family protein [Staphylococcus simulans]